MGRLHPAHELDHRVQARAPDQGPGVFERGGRGSPGGPSDGHRFENDRPAGGLGDPARVLFQPGSERAADVSETDQSDPKGRRHSEHASRDSEPGYRRPSRMADVMVSVPTTGSPAAAMSAVRSPATSAAVTARSIELAAFSLLSVKRRRRAALRMAPIGLATPRAARSGADPWIGSYNPRRPAPRLADGSIPSDPTSIDASSVRMSPNRFSVRTTSNAAGRRIKSMAKLSTSMCVKLTSGNRGATLDTTSRQS